MDNKSEETATENTAGGNIWGRKWSLISLCIICFFLAVATCRYLVIKPDRLVIPESAEPF